MIEKLMYILFMIGWAAWVLLLSIFPEKHDELIIFGIAVLLIGVATLLERKA